MRFIIKIPLPSWGDRFLLTKKLSSVIQFSIREEFRSMLTIDGNGPFWWWRGTMRRGLPDGGD
jgi:hypothetical protein